MRGAHQVEKVVPALYQDVSVQDKLAAGLLGLNDTDHVIFKRSAGGENDDQVTPAPYLDRLNEIFKNYEPDNLSSVVITGATHAFRLVTDPCESWVNTDPQEQSEQLLKF